MLPLDFLNLYFMDMNYTFRQIWIQENEVVASSSCVAT